MNWQDFEAGMAAARQVPDVARQATCREAADAGGPDFCATGHGDRSEAWHQGYDHAVVLARRSCS